MALGPVLLAVALLWVVPTAVGTLYLYRHHERTHPEQNIDRFEPEED